MNRLVALSLCSLFLLTAAAEAQNWTFAVSGDSRNCGDIVMPSIAEHVRADHAAFYWHLGDYRAFADVDQDMLAAHKGKVSVAEYLQGAWPDFINQQLAPFGDTPVFLAVGNHELIFKTRPELLTQFADWYDAPAVRAQRLADDPTDHALHGYYHWHEKNVDFITLDNASPDMFDPAQMKWIAGVLKRDAADPGIRTIVLGMHEALPDSQSAGHSMNESPIETETGRKVYAELLNFRDTTGKEVQVLASHSHFVMSDPYNTACRKPERGAFGVDRGDGRRGAVPAAGGSFALEDRADRCLRVPARHGDARGTHYVRLPRTGREGRHACD